MSKLKADILNTFSFFETPKLKESRHCYILEGVLGCSVEDYEFLADSFHVQIRIPFSFPRELPVVIEKSKKIPRDNGYHIDEKGKCCLGTELAIFDYLHQYKINSFSQYLEQVIIIHFFHIKHFLVTGEWLADPESHYTNGIIDSYKRIFNMTDKEIGVVVKGNFSGRSLCLCKSGKRFNKCHGRHTPYAVILKDFKKMKDHYGCAK